MLFIVSSCSSLSSLKFWGSDEIDPDEPKELKKILICKNINIDWNKSFSGDKLLGNFYLHLVLKSIFFADVNGNIKSIDSNSGNIQWEQEIGELLSSGIAAGFGMLVVSDVQGKCNFIESR